MKSKTINTVSKLALVLAIIYALAFKAYDYRLELAKEEMIADWTRAKNFTLEYVEAMPENGINYRPTDSVRAFSEQMLHLTSVNVGITYQVTGVTPPIEDARGLEKMEDLKNKEALTKVVTTGYDYVISSLESTSPEKLGEQIKLFGQFDLSGTACMQKAFEHQTHHRGQSAVYLRMAGANPPSMKLF